MKYVTVRRLFSGFSYSTFTNFSTIDGFRIRSSINSNLCLHYFNLHLSKWKWSTALISRIKTYKPIQMTKYILKLYSKNKETLNNFLKFHFFRIKWTIHCILVFYLLKTENVLNFLVYQNIQMFLICSYCSGLQSLMFLYSLFL